MSKRPKVTVVGAGFVGATTAQRILEKELEVTNSDKEELKEEIRYFVDATKKF